MANLPKVKKGDLLSATAWNQMIDQLNGIALKIPTNKGHLFGIGTGNPTAKLHIMHGNQNANGNTLILGPTNQSNLRLGYHQNYSWIQSHGSKPLAINPLGNNVGIGVTNPASKFQVHGLIHSSHGGIKFPDGSIQNRASQGIIIRSGDLAMNTTGSWKTSPLAKGNKKYLSPKIKLSGFTQPPHITFSIYHLDAKGDKNTRVSILAKEVSRTGFKIFFETWADSEIYGCNVRWLAIGQ